MILDFALFHLIMELGCKDFRFYPTSVARTIVLVVLTTHAHGGGGGGGGLVLAPWLEAPGR